MPVNPNQFIIKDSQTNLFCIGYNIVLAHCSWGNWQSAVAFDTQEEVDAAITAWGETPGQRYGGDRPPKPPQNP